MHSAVAKFFPRTPRPSQKRYPYESLREDRKEIRLIEVMCGQTYSPIECTIRKASLYDIPFPKYETVSYCWGDSKLYANISLNGQQISIPASSAATIRRIRSAHSNRTLWIDAVCINQFNTKERSQQVALMRDVYSNSIQNLIDLGESDPLDEAALTSIHLLADEMRTAVRHVKRVYDFFMHPDGALKSSDTSIEASINIDALEIFYSNRWFRRIWVVQEASMASTNIALRGTLTTDFTHILLAAVWLKFKHFSIPNKLSKTPGVENSLILFSQLESIRRFVQYPRIPLSMASILAFGYDLEASDKRDHVYGLLGLCRHEPSQLPDSLRPDYRKSADAVKLDATRFATQETKSGLGSVLMRVKHRSDADLCAAWPSWAPRWHQAYDNLQDCHTFDFGLFNAGWGGQSLQNGPGRRERSVLNPSSYLLSLRGVTVSSVKAITATYTPGLSLHGQERWLDTVEILTEALPPLYGSHLPEHALYMTVTGGSTAHHSLAHPEDSHRYKTLRRYVPRKRTPAPQMYKLKPSADEDIVTASECAQSIFNASKNRRFFVTCHGEIGIGPSAMRPRDVVAIFHGVCVPMILRRRRRKYRFVGHCYVYGIMQGEAIQKHHEQGRPDETFVIY